jgi:hypothetical protein
MPFPRSRRRLTGDTKWPKPPVIRPVSPGPRRNLIRKVRKLIGDHPRLKDDFEPRNPDNGPESSTVYGESQDETSLGGHRWPTETEASSTAETSFALANIESDLIFSAPRPHPAYGTLRHRHHVRLLRILPASSTTEIRCHLEEFSIRRRSSRSTPSYTALSYTWGSQYGTHQIYVNDHPLLVPKNLWRFLNHARDLAGDLSGWIWCDMLSINQVDLVERGNQVLLMSKIFSFAQTVVIWLGPAYRGSDIAMTALARLPTGEGFAKHASRIWASEAGHAMNDLCRRNYWRRLWIFQEVRLAHIIRLMCGGKTVSWDRFESLLQYADARSGTSRRDDSTEAVASSPAMRMMKLNLKSVDTMLWSLIQETKHLRCFDPRDKVYALLGVADKCHYNLIADYTIGMPTLLNRLLREFWAVSPPINFQQIRDWCAKIEDVLGVERGTIFIMRGQRGKYNAPSDADMRNCRLGPRHENITLWWAAFYGHSSVQKLLQETWVMSRFEGEMSEANEPSYASPALISLFKFLRKDMRRRTSFLDVGHEWLDEVGGDEDLDEWDEYYDDIQGTGEADIERIYFEGEPMTGDFSMLWVAYYHLLATHQREYHIARLMYGLMSLVHERKRKDLYELAMQQGDLWNIILTEDSG